METVLRIPYVDDIEKLSGILVKNGYSCQRVSVKSITGKSNVNALKIIGDGTVPKEDEGE